MKRFLLLLVSFIAYFGAFAQQSTRTIQSNEISKCGEFEALERMRLEDPIRYQMYQQSRAVLDQEEQLSVQKAGTIYTIPVVFHVLHNNGAENISDAQIQDAIQILNRDYRKLNADVNDVYPTFLSVTGDVEVEFALAKTAPNGNCFNGITRTVSTQTSNGSDGTAQVNAVIAGNDVYQGIWAHNKYLNIYVCDSIGGPAGYTYKPNGNSDPTASNMKFNGIFVLSDYVGSIGTSTIKKSRVLTHEIGHWLNLKHVWGDGIGVGEVCGDDDVADTPITKGFKPCPPSPDSAKVCNPSIVENYENYMDYSYCTKMFTEGQAAKMRIAIVSNVGGRSNIWTATNLVEVGVLPSSTSLCSAELKATSTTICHGTSTSFSVTNVSEPIISYSWSFPGGSPSYSTLANPTVTYATPGVYNASVTITTATLNRIITNTAYMNVVGGVLTGTLPIFEGFVGPTFPPTAWTIDNGGNSVTWNSSIKGIAPTEGNSARLNFAPGTNTIGDIDDLNLPIFSLSGYSSVYAAFDVAYRPFDEVFFDKLEVLISPGCGLPFEVVYSKAGVNLQTEPAGEDYTSPIAWRNELIDLTPYVGNSEVKVKFRGVSGLGNRVFLDNVNIFGAIGGAPLAIYTSSSRIICRNQTVTFTDASIGATTWSWDFGDGASPATATGAGPHVVSYASSGAKSVVLSINGGTSTFSNAVTVKGLPLASLASLPSVCVYDAPITLTQGTPAGGIYSGVSVFGNQFDPSIGVGSQTITYSVTSTISGCVNSVSKQITVEPCLGIESENANTFKLFPNPTSGEVTISSSFLISKVVVLDNVGRVVITLNPENSNEVTIDLSKVSSGSYLIQTKMGAITKMNKVVIE